MKRVTKTRLNRISRALKVQYHALSDVLVGEDNSYRTDKAKNAFLLLDLAICELNEIQGRNRSD